MTGRLFPTLVAVFALAAPAAAVAQTSDYTTTTTTQTTTVPPTTTTEPTTDYTQPTTTSQTTTEPTTDYTAPTPTQDDTDVAAQTDEGSAPAAGAPAPAVAQAGEAAGATPSTLAYTGSEVWLVGMIGLLALAGGVALMRTSRRT